jgi:hypothetical protein
MIDEAVGKHIDVVAAGCGKEAEMAEIKTYHGNARRPYLVYSTEQCAVAANRDNDIDCRFRAPLFNYRYTTLDESGFKSLSSFAEFGVAVSGVDCYFQG